MDQNQNLSANQPKQTDQNTFGEYKVNKKGFIEIPGEVIEVLPNLTFKVILENNHQILAHLSGRMRMHRIMVMNGDKVKVELSPYDLHKGRITYRN